MNRRFSSIGGSKLGLGEIIVESAILQYQPKTEKAG